MNKPYVQGVTPRQLKWSCQNGRMRIAAIITAGLALTACSSASSDTSEHRRELALTMLATGWPEDTPSDELEAKLDVLGEWCDEPLDRESQVSFNLARLTPESGATVRITDYWAILCPDKYAAATTALASNG